MAITRQKKEEIVAEVSDILSKAATVAFAKFKGLPVVEQNEMRKVLRQSGVGYRVAKKTLIRRALGITTIAGDVPELDGEIAIAYSEDELAPARELAVFIKKFPEQLSFAGGVFGGSYVSASHMGQIASIPGVDTLRAQFVQLINSPRQRFAVVLNAKASASE